MKYFLLFSLLVTLCSSCRIGCDDIEYLPITANLIHNGQNVNVQYADHFVNLRTWDGPPYTSSQSYVQLDFDSLELNFNSDMRQSCQDDTWIVFLSPEAWVNDPPGIDTIDFEMEIIGRENCGICRIINVSSRNGNEVNLTASGITLNLNI